ncbi:MAG: hypothetical protein HY619_07465 [Thaumarchaeota archaeon]|nr:hypothetical protein [Nitrososphaerota archaeon]
MSQNTKSDSFSFEGARRAENLLQTGHPVFDKIVKIRYGSSILMLDETFSGAKNFLSVLFGSYAKDRADAPIEVRMRGKAESENVVVIQDSSISEVSIALSALREKHRGRILIHHELPDLLISNNAEVVLKTFQFWQPKTMDATTVEFYLLPKGTFEEVEKKILPFVEGVVEINVRDGEKRSELTFTPIGCCEHEHHLRSFPYKIEGERLLIEWAGGYTDEVREFSTETVDRLLNRYTGNLDSLKVVASSRPSLATLSVYDYWLLSQIVGKSLRYVSMIFPEQFEAILKKLSHWDIDGLVKVVESEGSLKEHLPKESEPKFQRRFVSLALALPTRVTSALIAAKTGKIHRVPADVLSASRMATVSLLNILLENTSAGEAQMRRIIELEKRFGEITARLTALKRISHLGEGPNPKVDMKHLEKIIATTFLIGYQIRPKIRKISGHGYEIVLTDCSLCKEITAKTPVCSQFSGTIEGICGVVFKLRTSCEEVDCRAMGEKVCRFVLNIMQQ